MQSPGSDLPPKHSILRSLEQGRAWIVDAAGIEDAMRHAELSLEAGEYIVKVLQLTESSFYVVAEMRSESSAQNRRPA